MKVINFLEQDDGSAIVEVDMTPEEMTFILEIGFTKMLEDSMEKFKDEFKSRPTDSGE